MAKGAPDAAGSRRAITHQISPEAIAELHALEAKSLPDVVVPAAALAARNVWELRLKFGQCTLQEGLFGMLQSGAPATDYLMGRLRRAFDDYATGQNLLPGKKRPKNLAQEFGTVRWNIQPVRKRLAALAVHDLVEELHAKHHLALGNESARTRKTGPTAFSKAAEGLRMSESAVVKKYYEGKSLHDCAAGSELK